MCLLDRDLDQFKDPVQIIHSRGFDSEKHKTITSDGYILEMFRIINPHKRHLRLKPILLMHGIMVSCHDFMVNTHGLIDTNGLYVEQRYGNRIAFRQIKGQSVAVGGALAFVLSQFGYDVWLGNFRGTRYSANHTYLTQSDINYWSFTLDDLIQYDMPALIDYIIHNTRAGVIGHSMGATVMFGLLSSQLDYNLMIDPFIALAPVVFNSHNKLWHQLSTFITPILKARIGSLIPKNEWLMSVTSDICQALYWRYVCGLLIGLLTGHNFKQWDVSRFGTATSYSPDGLPGRVVAQYFQFALRGKFERYDFGIEDNVLLYGQTEPPIYNLELIHTNVALFYSFTDGYLNPIDISILKHKLKQSLIYDYEVPEPKWSHIDYFIGKESGFYSNSHIIDILRLIDDMYLNEASNEINFLNN